MHTFFRIKYAPLNHANCTPGIMVAVLTTDYTLPTDHFIQDGIPT